MKVLKSAAVAVVMLAAGSVAFAELDAAQKKLLADASRYLDQGDANLKSAKDGVGTGPATASKVKLAQARLESVAQSVAQAKARLSKLPADDAEVAEQNKRITQLNADVAAFVETVNGQQNPKPENTKPATPAPTPAAEGKPKPAPAGAQPGAPAGETKLDYRQRESLKNAQFHARDATGKAAALAELASKVSKAADPGAIDVRQLQAGVNTLADVKQKLKNANDQLAGVPADGQGVADVVEQIRLATESVAASEAILAPAHESVVGKLDPKNLPNLATDTKRLQELGQMYGNPQLLESDRRRAAELVTLAPEALKEHDRIVAEYALLIQQQTEDGRRIAGSGAHFKSRLDEFQKLAADRKAALPADIDADLADANRLADQAVNEQKPAFFGEGNGIDQRMGWATEKLVLLTALDPEAAKAATARIDAARAAMKTRQAALREGIIQANQLPADNYTGADRAALEALAIDTWKQEQGGEITVLKIRIPSQNWDRETLWRYENRTWRFVDRSRLQAQIILRHDDKLAINRPVNLVKDHTKNDQVSAYPFDTKTDEVPPQRFYLIEKAK